MPGRIDIGAGPRCSVAAMAATPETGFLVIADLTGYTAYLAGSELEHAPVIAGDLLETIVGRLDPPFRLAKFEGDAGFLFVEDGRAAGSLLVDAIEACYLAFRRRLRSIDAATSCDCASCRLAPRLDLKVFVHHGSYVHSRIAGRDELAGTDVILAHRLLKGDGRGGGADGRLRPVHRVRRSTRSGSIPPPWGWPRARSRSSTSVPSRPSSGTSSHAGRRRAASAGWTASEGDVVLDVETAFAAEPSVVWAHLTTPALRSRWEGPLVIEESSVGGRRGVGTITQCVTGRLATIEEVVDWQPYDHIGWRVTVPDVGPVQATVDLDPVEGGTRVHLRWTVGGPGPADADTLRRDRAREARGAGTTRAGARRGSGHHRSTGGRDMIRYSSEVTIARPPHAVYEALLDPDTLPEVDRHGRCLVRRLGRRPGWGCAGGSASRRVPSRGCWTWSSPSSTPTDASSSRSRIRLSTGRPSRRSRHQG